MVIKAEKTRQNFQNLAKAKSIKCKRALVGKIEKKLMKHLKALNNTLGKNLEEGQKILFVNKRNERYIPENHVFLMVIYKTEIATLGIRTI